MIEKITHEEPSRDWYDFCPAYCKETYTDSGRLTKIERTEWIPWRHITWNGERRMQHTLRFATIWKPGWHHIKGARKKARQA